MIFITKQMVIHHKIVSVHFLQHIIAQLSIRGIIKKGLIQFINDLDLRNHLKIIVKKTKKDFFQNLIINQTTDNKKTYNTIHEPEKKSFHLMDLQNVEENKHSIEDESPSTDDKASI